MVLPDPPKIVYEDDCCMVATWRSLVMPVMGRTSLHVASAKQQARALLEHGKRLGQGKMAEITIIAHDAPLPGPETRAAFDAAVPMVTPYYGCVSAVFDGTGFRGAFVRGMLTSFQMLSRNKFPQKVFSSIDDAAKWTFTHAASIGMTVDSPDEIVEAARFVRRHAVKVGVFGPHAEIAPENAGAAAQ
jgi:hypothetical protein